MTQRFNLYLPDDLSELLESVAELRQTSKGEVVAKSLLLYAASLRGRREGFAVGLVDPKTMRLVREFVGL